MLYTSNELGNNYKILKIRAGSETSAIHACNELGNNFTIVMNLAIIKRQGQGQKQGRFTIVMNCFFKEQGQKQGCVRLVMCWDILHCNYIAKAEKKETGFTKVQYQINTYR